MDDFFSAVLDLLFGVVERKDISETKDDIIKAYYSREKDRNAKLAKAVGTAVALLVMSAIFIWITMSLN